MIVRKLAAATMMSVLTLFAFAPAANALVLDLTTGLLPPVHVEVLEPDPTPALVDADLTNDALDLEVLSSLVDDDGLGSGLDVNVVTDLAILPVLEDPLVHVCVNGVVQTVLASVALNLHLDVLGADEGCAPVTTVTTTPPSPGDPLVHICVNGVVQSVLASVAANLHLDVLGSDNNCPGSVGPTPPGGADDPLVHVCVDGAVNTLLASVALNLHLDILGSDDSCPPGTVPPGTVPPVNPDNPVTQPPGTVTPGAVTIPVTDTSSAVTDGVEKAETSKKNSGPLAFTGNGWVQLLAGLGLAALVAGLLLKRLGKI